jgi:hypothetical protein
MKLEQNKNYRAEISLGMLESFASNEMIEAKLKGVGFKNIKVFGSGANRSATGTYIEETKDVSLPAQIRKLEETA